MQVNFHGAINRDLTTIQMSNLTSVYYIVFGTGDQRVANSRFARGREREMIYFRYTYVTTRVFVYIQMIPMCLSCKTVQIMINIMTQQLASYSSDIVKKSRNGILCERKASRKTLYTCSIKELV